MSVTGTTITFNLNILTMYSEQDFKNIITYYNSFASEKEQYYINRILNKDTPSAWDKQFLDTILRRLRVRFNTTSTNVDSRLKAIKNNPYKVSVIDNNKTE